MSQDFESIPIEVWKLFDEILNFGEPVNLLGGTERMHAMSIAWGWNPPLMENGTSGRLTRHGLAAVGWRRCLVKRQGAPLNHVGVGPLSFKPSLRKEVPSKAIAEPNNDVSLDAKALAVFIEHPDWTKKKIAAHLRKHEKSLAPKRCPTLANAIAASKAKPTARRGTKDSAGNVEAWDE